MSITTSIASNKLVRILPSHSFQTFFFNPIFHLAISKHKNGSGFPVNPTLQSYHKTKRDLIVYSSVQPGPAAPLPSGSPPNSWRSWMLGMLVTVILPFFSHKWGPLLKWTKEIEAAVETIENIVEGVEDVAEKVDKVAEDIGHDLPEGGKLQIAVDLIENVAEKIAKDAHLVGDFIDKVQEVEDKVEAFIEPAVDQKANEVAKEI